MPIYIYMCIRGKRCPPYLSKYIHIYRDKEGERKGDRHRRPTLALSLCMCKEKELLCWQRFS